MSELILLILIALVCILIYHKLEHNRGNAGLPYVQLLIDTITELISGQPQVIPAVLPSPPAPTPTPTPSKPAPAVKSRKGLTRPSKLVPHMKAPASATPPNDSTIMTSPLTTVEAANVLPAAPSSAVPAVLSPLPKSRLNDPKRPEQAFVLPQSPRAEEALHMPADGNRAKATTPTPYQVEAARPVAKTLQETARVPPSYPKDKPQPSTAVVDTATEKTKLQVGTTTDASASQTPVPSAPELVLAPSQPKLRDNAPAPKSKVGATSLPDTIPMEDTQYEPGVHEINRGAGASKAAAKLAEQPMETTQYEPVVGEVSGAASQPAVASVDTVAPSRSPHVIIANATEQSSMSIPKSKVLPSEKRSNTTLQEEKEPKADKTATEKGKSKKAKSKQSKKVGSKKGFGLIEYLGKHGKSADSGKKRDETPTTPNAQQKTSKKVSKNLKRNKSPKRSSKTGTEKAASKAKNKSAKDKANKKSPSGTKTMSGKAGKKPKSKKQSSSHL